MQVSTKAEVGRKFDWFYLVIAEFSVCNLGNYAVMTILALYFVHTLNLSAAAAGALLLFTSLSFRLSRLLLAPIVDRFPIRQAMFLSLLLTSVGYLGMAFDKIPLLVVFLLFVIGVGHSTNGLLVKTLAAQAKKRGETTNQSPFLRYASLTTGVNLAAALGSILGGTLLFRWGPTSVFLVAATTYALSAVITTRVPATETGKSQSINWGVALKLTLKRPAIWRAMLFAFLGWFLYTQSYASLPLFVNDAVHRPDLLGSVFTLNAVLVVVGQLPVSRAIIYFRLPTSQSVLLAFLAFAGGFALLWLFPSWQIVYVAVGFWTLGEILLMPALDTLVAEGALVEHRQVAFAVYSAAVALGEGLGNLFGVSLADFLLKSGSLSALYVILTFGGIGAMIVTIFAAKRNESLVLRLLKGQSPIPTGRTQLLSLQPEPMEKAGMGQSLLTWLSAGSYHEELNFFEAHPELVALDTGQLEDFVAQQPEQAGSETLADRLFILRDIRSRISTLVRMAYVNMYGGLILDLPPWLDEMKQQLATLEKAENPAQTAFELMTLLNRAITRARSEPSLPAEIMAELRVLYAVAALEAQIPERAEVVEAACTALQEALKVYTLAQYPYQYARTNVFLSLTYQARLKGDRRANIEQAIACYEAASQGYKSDPFPMQDPASQINSGTIHSPGMIQAKLAELEQAMASCRITLQNIISQEHLESEPTQRLGPIAPLNVPQRAFSAAQDADKTLIVKDFIPARFKQRSGEDDDPDKTLIAENNQWSTRAAAHVEWIASQTTQLTPLNDPASLRSMKQQDRR